MAQFPPPAVDAAKKNKVNEIRLKNKICDPLSWSSEHKNCLTVQQVSCFLRDDYPVFFLNQVRSCIKNVLKAKPLEESP